MGLQLFVSSDEITNATSLCASTSFLITHTRTVNQVSLYAETTPRMHGSMVNRRKQYTLSLSHSFVQISHGRTMSDEKADSDPLVMLGRDLPLVYTISKIWR